MSDSTNVVRQYFEAVPRRDFDTIRQILHPEYSYAAGDGERREGPEAGVAVVDMYTTAFPDLNVDVMHMHASADGAVVTEFVARGTHRGALMGIAPTGRTVAVPVCNVIEVRDGKIYAEREYLDTAHLMQQLGVGT